MQNSWITPHFLLYFPEEKTLYSRYQDILYLRQRQSVYNSNDPEFS